MNDLINKYDHIYLEIAENSIGSMLDYAVYSLHQNAASFYGLFSASEAARLFESGDPGVLCGMSGIELACRVMELSGLEYDRVRPRFTTSKSKEYAAGRILARCQWESGRSFSELTEQITVSEIITMYDSYVQNLTREIADAWPPVMDAYTPEAKAKRSEEAITFCADSVIKKMSSAECETHLKSMRLLSGMSQSQLARASGVPVRTIQQYEQRQKNISKAQSEYLIALAYALHCDPKQLLE